MVGEELLVPGDDRFAGLECVKDELACRLDAADDLDHEIDIGVVHDRCGVGREQRLVDGDWTILRDRAHGDAGDLEVEPGALRDVGTASVDELHE